jgi:nucleoside-diphosphate-sugar epimerase
METILVTGAAGFVGCKTASLLLEQGFAVVGVDNLNDYYDVRLKYYRLETLKANRDFTFLQADIESINELEPIFRDHTLAAVINLAARAGVRYSLRNPYVYMNTNVCGTLNLLELMRKHSVNKMVLASSSSLYAGQEMPFSEELPVNTPITPYAASKKAAEMTAYTYHYLYGIDVSVLRYFTVYGPAGRPDMSPFRFIKWIDEETQLTLYGDGSQNRDFTYVDDIAEGTIKALQPLGFEIINLGDSQPHALSQLISLIESNLGKRARISYQPCQKADMKETWADIDKARKLLNWYPKTPLDEGVRGAVAWHIEHRSLVRQIDIDLSV